MLRIKYTVQILEGSYNDVKLSFGGEETVPEGMNPVDFLLSHMGSTTHRWLNRNLSTINGDPELPALVPTESGYTTRQPDVIEANASD